MMNAKIGTVFRLVGGAFQAFNTRPKSQTVEELPLFWIGQSSLPTERPLAALSYGPEHEVTRYLRADYGVQLALSEYKKRGYADLTGPNAFTYTPNIIKSKNITWEVLFNRVAGAFPGGYRVEVRNLKGSSKRSRLGEISVFDHLTEPLPTEQLDERPPIVQGRSEETVTAPVYRWIEEISTECCES